MSQIRPLKRDPTTGQVAEVISSDTVYGAAAPSSGSDLTNKTYTDGTFLPLAGGTLTGNLIFSADNSHDIGAVGATRPRTVFVGTSVLAPLFNAGTGFQIGGAAATAGHVLRADGTNYVDAQLAFADTSGTVGLSRGGTNADLSATGGAHSFLAQDASHVVSARAIGTGDVPSGVVTWDLLGNAAGALTLANGTNATTFNQTSAVNWTWANTTAATNSNGGGTFVTKTSAVTSGTPSGSVNTTGATLLVAVISGFSAAATIVDSQGNDWNYLTTYLGFNTRPETRIAYSYSKGGGALSTSAAHTFTVSATGTNYPTGVIYAFSNTLTTAAVYDTSSGTSGSSTQPIVPGSITPTAGDIVVTGMGVYSGSSPSYASATVSQGFSSPDTALNTVATTTGSSGAYILNASGSAYNPSWSANSSAVSGNTAVIACFKTQSTSTNSSSPIWNLDGTYWNGSASAADTWTIQDVIDTATTSSTPKSILTFAHSGSSGSAAVNIPLLNLGGTDAGISRLGAASLAVGNGTAGDFTGSLKLTGENNQGGYIVHRATKAAGYTTTATDYVLSFTATATLVLDSGAAVSGTTYRIKLSASATAGAVLTVAPNNSKTIDSAATLVMAVLGQAVDVVYDAVTNDWQVF